MSGGQQQRVALARALVNRPQALLLDEPLGALDLRLRKQLQIELSHIQREVGITFVHVTHDQEEAMTMADTIAVMKDGRIDQLGSATELYDRPRTEFVANFLGSSNLIDATVASRAADVVDVRHRRRDGPRPGDARRRPATATCRVGVRPEKIAMRPVDAGAAGGRRERARRPRHRRGFLGVSTQYIVRTDGGHDIQVFAQNSGAGLETIGPGRRVAAVWEPEHTFVVPKEEQMPQRRTDPQEPISEFLERLVNGDAGLAARVLQRFAAAG